MTRLTKIIPKSDEATQIPEIFTRGEFTPVSEVIGKECTLIDYRLYTSTKEIYAEGNSRGVVILASCAGKEIRLSTHAKAIVRDFEAIATTPGLDPSGMDFRIAEKSYKGKRILVIE